VSAAGKKDGLYWPESDGDKSPFGEFIAQASAEGYKPEKVVRRITVTFIGF
jgi:hypothetical protein